MVTLDDMQVLQTNLTKPTKHFLGGKTKRRKAPRRNRTKYSYDDRNRVISETRPDGGSTTIVYTADNGQIVESISTDIYKDDGGSPSFVETQAKTNTYNILGQLKKTVDDNGANGVQTEYTYHGSGLLHKVKVNDDTDTETTFDYDDAGNQISVDGPDYNGTMTSEYTAFGSIKKFTDAKTPTPNVLRWEYDKRNRVRFLYENGAKTGEWIYDTAAYGVGLLHQRKYKTNEFAETISYNSSSRVDGINTDINISGFSKSFSHTYTYNATDHRLETVGYPSGITAKYHYNASGYLWEVTDAVTAAPLVTYDTVDAFGNVTFETYGNEVETERVFDPLSGRLSDIDTTSTSTTFQDNHYEWRTNGILESRLANAGAQSLSEIFTYDKLNRIKTAATSLGGTPTRLLETNFDNLGNLLEKKSNVSGDPDLLSYSYTGPTNSSPFGLNTVSIDGVSHTLEYDDNGNVEEIADSSGFGKYLTWNARNQAEKVERVFDINSVTYTNSDEFAYGPHGARFYRKSTWYDTIDEAYKTEHTFYVGAFEELVTDANDTSLDKVQKSRIGSSVLHTKQYLDNQTTVSSIEYLHRDHLGSVERVTDQSGAEKSALAFDPYGERRKDDWSRALTESERDDEADAGRTSTTRGYTDHEYLDRTGIIHMNGRIYDPQLGRFLSPDPIVQSPGHSQSWNRYSYVMNSPLSATDPSGFSSIGAGGMFGQGPVPGCEGCWSYSGNGAPSGGFSGNAGARVTEIEVWWERIVIAGTALRSFTEWSTGGGVLGGRGGCGGPTNDDCGGGAGAHINLGGVQIRFGTIKDLYIVFKAHYVSVVNEVASHQEASQTDQPIDPLAGLAEQMHAAPRLASSDLYSLGVEPPPGADISVENGFRIALLGRTPGGSNLQSIKDPLVTTANAVVVVSTFGLAGEAFAIMEGPAAVTAAWKAIRESSRVSKVSVTANSLTLLNAAAGQGYAVDAAAAAAYEIWLAGRAARIAAAVSTLEVLNK